MNLRRAASVSVLVLAACSGAAATDLFVSPAPSSTMGTEPEPGAPDAAEDATPPDDAEDASTGADAQPDAGRRDAGADAGRRDAGADSAVDASEPDAGWKSPGIACGEDGAGVRRYCATGELCCSGSNVSTHLCAPRTNAGCPSGIPISCDDPSDCAAGQTCCGIYDTRSGFARVQCQSTCKDAPGRTAFEFCDPKAPTDTCSGGGRVCDASRSLDGFYVCR